MYICIGYIVCGLSYTFPPTGMRVLGQSYMYMYVYMYLVYIRGCVMGYMYYQEFIIPGTIHCPGAKVRVIARNYAKLRRDYA